MSRLIVNDILSRVHLDIPLDTLAQNIATDFELGSFVSITPMMVGYEEFNARLQTDKGQFVVKIFAKQKDGATIESNVRALDAFYAGGVPVPAMYKDINGEYMYRINQRTDAYLIVMDYFEGKKFTQLVPTIEDVVSITEYVSRIHQLSFETHPVYDMWLTVNLVEEFDKKKEYLESDDLLLIKPVVERFRAIDMEKLSKSIVHFDLHRENVMKSNDGKYCILDLATVTYSYTVFDLATFIGLFCFDGARPLADNMFIYKRVMETYLKFRSLSDYEQSVLLLLIQATFASNLLIPSYVQKTGQDDNPQQTIYYQSLGKNGLKMLVAS